MPLFIDWTPETENGARFIETTDNPINPANGPYSLLAESDGTEWDVIFPGFRKSASVYLKKPPHVRGFSDGRIRTLVRRNSANQSEGWSGIFFLSDRVGIGTRLDPGLNMYQVSDEDSTIKIFKVVGGIKILLFDTGINPVQGTVYGFEVEWEYEVNSDTTTIDVKYGTNIDFTDLALIGSVTDGDSVVSPHQFSLSEGLFFQTESSDDFVSYNYDTTSIFRIVTL
jgi:hypothetical protein